MRLMVGALLVILVFYLALGGLGIGIAVFVNSLFDPIRSGFDLVSTIR